MHIFCLPLLVVLCGSSAGPVFYFSAADARERARWVAEVTAACRKPPGAAVQTGGGPGGVAAGDNDDDEVDDDVKPWDAPESLTSWLEEQRLHCERKLVEQRLNVVEAEPPVDLGPVDMSLVLVFDLTENDAGERTLGNMHEAWSIWCDP